MRERAVGVLLVVLLAWHTYEKVQTGLLPEMAWGCHIATAVAALGALGAVPGLVVLGGLLHLVFGLPGWLLEVSLHGTTASSTALHIASPAVGIRWAWVYGVPRWLPLAGVGFGLGIQAIGRLFDPALNVNMAWRAYEVLPPTTPLWVSHLLNLSLVVVSLTAIVWIAPRLRRG